MLEENLKLIDVVVELVDARAPLSTRNPDFDALFSHKRRVILMNKSDLAAPAVSKRFIAWYRKQGILAAEIAAGRGGGKKEAVTLIEESVREERERLAQKGVQKTVRALIVGIPNVGKSTFINCLAGGKRAETGDRPGVTRGKQWIKITPYLELMDSPGLLWPKLDNQMYARNLAFIGSVNDEILDLEQLAGELLAVLRDLVPQKLTERYTKIQADIPPELLLEAVCKSRGFVLRGGLPDTERAARVVLDEFRGGKIARVTLDSPP